MAEQKIGNLEYFDLINVLCKNRDLIGEAYSRGLPLGFYDKNTVERIESLRDCGVLNQDLKLCEAFRKALDEVGKGREVEQFSTGGMRDIVDRYRDWHHPNDHAKNA